MSALATIAAQATATVDQLTAGARDYRTRYGHTHPQRLVDLAKSLDAADHLDRWTLAVWLAEALLRLAQTGTAVGSSAVDGTPQGPGLSPGCVSSGSGVGAAAIPGPCPQGGVAPAQAGPPG